MGLPDAPREWSLKPRIEYESNNHTSVVASCYSSECADIRIHPAHRSCWCCGQDQYFACVECHVHRRWTSFPTSANDICMICVDHYREQERVKQQEHSADIQQKKRDTHAPRTSRNTRVNELIKSKISGYRRNKSEQLSLF